ncbi:MAG: hypothetical protein JXA33_19630, partial [Anaerolineae bacterium]|nr:hypothetical protein [Anaerolineae bacterium]
MKSKRNLILLALTMLLAVLVIFSFPVNAGLPARMFSASGAPQVVSYQGQVTVDGMAYSGSGYFKFAVVNADGNTTYWSNDGTASGGGEPTNAVQLTVTNGLFNILLGDTSLTNMTALPASAFDGTERTLRVWFMEDGGSTFTLLSPDRRIAAVPYALQAEEAKLAGDADTLDGYHASDLLAGGSGWRLTGNAGTDPAANFIGTTDDVTFTVRVNNTAALRIVPNATSPNLIGGYGGNWVSPGVFGGVINGGGQNANLNRVTDHFGIIGGGQNNQAGNNDADLGNAHFATIAGGWNNIAGGESSAIGGGYNNTTGGSYVTVGGGANHIANG